MISWEKVTTKTVANCFRHAGFTKQDALEIEELTDDFDEADNVPLSRLMSTAINMMTDDELLELATVDNDLEPWGDMFEQDIVHFGK